MADLHDLPVEVGIFTCRPGSFAAFEAVVSCPHQLAFAGLTARRLTAIIALQA